MTVLVIPLKHLMCAELSMVNNNRISISEGVHHLKLSPMLTLGQQPVINGILWQML